MDDAAAVVVLGAARLDLFPDGAVVGGAPFNQARHLDRHLARHLAALGAVPLMVTRIGCDAVGERIAAEFARFGMSTLGLQRDSQRATGVVQVPMDGLQQGSETGAAGAWDALDRATLVLSVEAAQPSRIRTFKGAVDPSLRIYAAARAQWA